MSEYVLGHQLRGEGTRLNLMSELLDPMHRRYIEALGVVKPGAHTVEVGCGNGSISAWLAEHVSPGGTAVAVDLTSRGTCILGRLARMVAGTGN
jgi:hypothetical protein